jgi:DNA-binding XRE family transcriptional regulator
MSVIKYLRDKTVLSQRGLGKKFGVNYQQINRYEKKALPTLDNFLILIKNMRVEAKVTWDELGNYIDEYYKG